MKIASVVSAFALLWSALVPAQAQLQATHATPLLEQLDSPWGISFLDEQKFVFTERSGTLVVASLTPENNAEILARINVSNVIPDIFVNAQAGLFDVLNITKNESENLQLLLSYACGVSSANQTCVARTELTKDLELENTTVIFRATPTKKGAAHFGGRLLQLPDSTILVTLGDGFDYREQAQVTTNLLGSIARIDTSGRTPNNNPFIGTENAAPNLFSYGHRNVQGIAYHAEWNAILSTEHGPRGGDELNHIRGGRNYGWPLLTNGVDYTGAMITPYRDLPGMEPPLYDWTPSIAPAGLTLFENTALIPALAARKITALTLSQRGQQISVLNEYDLVSESTDITWNHRVRDIELHPTKSSILVLVDGTDGQIIELEITDAP
ncbi:MULTISPECIES: PQQ-dependent sugar dehydrogenase [Gammaproteobacteria]|uniref:PQQ-dependent sugar dehydrogenase n=1 Tax=Gammaproteobacteria TaxID=1236 RepID=UPI000DD04191|nr:MULTISPECIES: PQQ-dependent sugar dehydrogenase [Gammaproteobacteria]RTE87742.1 PQQ-dependent sugar dehydrogenase [Aliidiomarina sp. B3213]TCZ92476.1 PQQ-dependent sugar dehydrogenase [Lysobacter sp. N42]